MDNGKLKQTCPLKRKKNTKAEEQFSDTEETLRIERIKRVINQEQQLACAKQMHEENVNNIKENHFKKINRLELQHLKEIQTLQIEIKKAQLKAIR